MPTETIENQTPTHPSNPGQRLVRVFASMAPGVAPDADLMRGLYAPEVCFVDPMQRVQGLSAFEATTRRFVDRARTLSVTVHNVCESETAIYVSWTFVVKLRGTPTMTIPGVTHAKLQGGHITHHTDYWDFLGAVAGATPAKGLVQWVLQRLA